MTASSQDNSISLPVTDSLDVARQEYQYNYTHIPSVAMVDQLPPAERFSRSWYFLLAEQLRVLFVNTLIANRGNRGSSSIRDDVKMFIFEALIKGAIPARISVIARLLLIVPQLLIRGISKELREIDDLLFSLLKESGVSILRDALNRVIALLYKDQPTGHATSLKDYEKLFPVIALPTIANNFQDDEVFAYMRVAGYNPVMIERVTSLSDRFPVKDEQYQAVMGSDDSLAAAGQEGRLYLADVQNSV
jgi:arachidonate 15-lipoxygenase